MPVPSVLLTVAQWVETDDLTKSQVENLFLGGIIICGIAILFVLRQFQKTGTRLVVVCAVAALAGLMYWQRDGLEDCTGQCTCEMFGRELAIRDEDAFCPDN